MLFLSLLASAFLFKEKIIGEFIREANKSLSTPVTIGEMDVSVFANFPHLSIVLQDVYIEDSHEGKYPLLTAAEVSFELSAVQLWRGNYTINGLNITNSEATLKINANGKNNYTIINKKGDGSGGSVTFELNDIQLKNTVVHYNDLTSDQYLTFKSADLEASINSVNDVYAIKAEGDLTTERISVNKNEFLTGKSFRLRGDLSYDDLAKSLVIRPSRLWVRNSEFDVHGSYHWKESNLIDITTVGKDTDIQTLLSLLTEPVARKFQRYKSKGDVFITARLHGEIGKRVTPAISINFGFNDATVYNPDSRSEITHASMKGSFNSKQILDIEKAVLHLQGINGKLNGAPFTADFRLANFNDPEVKCAFKGLLDASAVMDFYPIEKVNDVRGSLLADVSFEGRTNLLKKKSTAQGVRTSGTIDLRDIGFSFDSRRLTMNDLSGNMQFNNNDLALSNVSGNLGKSDFVLNGFFKNIVTYLLFENQPVGIEADLRSKFLDIDELLAMGFSKPSAEHQPSGKPQYEFDISKNINLNFQCDVGALRYRRFYATKLSGDLLVKNQTAVSRNIRFSSMGGDMTFSGIVDSRNNRAVDVVSNFKLSGIHADSIFYVFENFNQNFIIDKHLKGQAYADVSLEFALSQNLKLYQETLVCDISTSIRNGELNNFEPMKKLNKYLNDEGLSRLRFSDLKNDIHIENKTIYIPEMEVRTNVTSIKVSGTHTFDQRIDYRLIAPLRNNKHINSVEAKAALEEDGSGQSKLFLKILGTTDNYRVVYDAESVKKKIGSDLKKEVKELKDAFRNKGKEEKKEVELEEEEYFEWSTP